MYHVTLRGNHQQDIFFIAADRQRFSDLVAEALAKFGARLHAYCYMTNHIHVLVQVGDTPIGKLILRIASRYARTTQARLQTTGHFFERRYHSVLVDADSYFIELLRYIHLNPVDAGMARTPDAYPWSSHHAYSGTRQERWLTTDFGWSLFASEQSRAIDAYRRFIGNALRAENSESPYDAAKCGDPRILGSDEFARRLLGASWKPRSRMTLDELVQEASAHFSVNESQLVSARRNAKLVAARAWIVRRAVEEGVASISAVARRLNRDESSMRHALKVCASIE